MFYNFDEFKTNGGERNYYKVQTQQQIGCLADEGEKLSTTSSLNTFSRFKTYEKQ